MNGSTWLELLPAILAAILAAFALYVLMQRLWPKAPLSPTIRAKRPLNQPVFLFESNTLIDASASGAQLIADRPDGMSERDALFHLLWGDFPQLTEEFDLISPGEVHKITPMNGSPLVLTLTGEAQLKRIVLSALDGEDVDLHYATLARTAFGEELSLLRGLANSAPQLIWREDDTGRCVWANRAYLNYADRCAPDAAEAAQVWPGQPLFPNLKITPPDSGKAVQTRASLRLNGNSAEHWFDITSIPLEGGLAHFAADANAVVRAEDMRREFMQTLAKTFAQLSAGLAIFDQRRQLTMFNPALLDMTGLPFDFLSAHPTIDSFLNRMRDTRRLPEPKNYASWREQFLTLEAEAKRGTYSENWNLPDGQTFRVTGRPHPDGALAFMFEDISAEVSLTRHFRTELETSQAVLDTLPDAIAVFSGANTLVLTNRAYRNLWNIEEEDVLHTIDLPAAMSTWKAATIPTPIWQRLISFANTFETRGAWSDTITLLDGRQATCHATPLAGRMTMVRFEMTSPERAALKALVADNLHAAKLAKR